jgi:energy-coupling factor transporter ATP-binding protein EcfA2
MTSTLSDALMACANVTPQGASNCLWALSTARDGGSPILFVLGPPASGKTTLAALLTVLHGKPCKAVKLPKNAKEWAAVRSAECRVLDVPTDKLRLTKRVDEQLLRCPGLTIVIASEEFDPWSNGDTLMFDVMLVRLQPLDTPDDPATVFGRFGKVRERLVTALHERSAGSAA